MATAARAGPGQSKKPGTQFRSPTQGTGEQVLELSLVAFPGATELDGRQSSWDLVSRDKVRLGIGQLSEACEFLPLV